MKMERLQTLCPMLYTFAINESELILFSPSPADQFHHEKLLEEEHICKG